MAHYHAQEEQPGLEVAREAEAPQVCYDQGLPVVVNHAQHHNPNFTAHSTQQQYYGGPPPQFDPYRHSTYTGSSPAYSALTPASDGKMLFEGPPGPPGPAMEKPPGGEVNLRIGKNKLWIILGSLAAVLVLGISLGLGLGLGLSPGGDGSSSNASPSSTPSPSSTASPESSISCPASDGANFTSTTTTTTADAAEFEIYCAIDYNSNADSDTRDLVHMEADTAEGCINMCAANDSCVGAGWGWYQPDSSVAGSDVCWLKSRLGTSHAAIEDWVFVIRK